MPEKILGPLEGASETLLISLYLRARESQHPGAMLRDDLAVAMINQFQYDFSQIRLQHHDEVVIIMRTISARRDGAETKIDPQQVQP